MQRCRQNDARTQICRAFETNVQISPATAQECAVSCILYQRLLHRVLRTALDHREDVKGIFPARSCGSPFSGALRHRISYTGEMTRPQFE
jgi:hypothetical protein